MVSEVRILKELREILSDTEWRGEKRLGWVRSEERVVAKSQKMVAHDGNIVKRVIVLYGNDSNVRRGSGMDGRGWREFVSFVRRKGSGEWPFGFAQGKREESRRKCSQREVGSVPEPLG